MQKLFTMTRPARLCFFPQRRNQPPLEYFESSCIFWHFVEMKMNLKRLLCHFILWFDKQVLQKKKTVREAFLVGIWYHECHIWKTLDTCQPHRKTLLHTVRWKKRTMKIFDHLKWVWIVTSCIRSSYIMENRRLSIYLEFFGLFMFIQAPSFRISESSIQF